MPPSDGREDSEGELLEGVDEATVLAKQRELRAPGPSARLTELVREQEVASRPEGLKLGDAAHASVKAFHRDVGMLNERAKIELDHLNEGWPTELERPLELVDSDLVHVFGPDVGKTGGPQYYKYEFTWPDEGYAGASHHSGEFFASNYTLDRPKWTVAQVGAQLKPSLAACKLSIRPYVKWSGYDIFSHRVHQPGSHEQRWATALASTGICVESWNEAGGGHFAEAPRWTDEWVRHEVNPSGSREYEGVSTPISGLQAEVFALGSRWYAIWILCRVHVSADPGFAVSTSSTASISCKVPFFVVEEIPL